MVCPTIRLITSSVILSLSSGCATIPQGPGPGAYCELYTKQIAEKGDGEAIAGLKRPGLKRRILINEKLYRTCPQPG